MIPIHGSRQHDPSAEERSQAETRRVRNDPDLVIEGRPAWSQWTPQYFHRPVPRDDIPEASPRFSRRVVERFAAEALRKGGSQADADLERRVLSSESEGYDIAPVYWEPNLTEASRYKKDVVDADVAV